MGTINNRLTNSQKIALVAVFSALLTVVRALKLPLRLPGVGGMPWFIILLIASLIIRIPLPATEVALFGGLVNSFMFDNPPGPLSLIKYLSAGIIIDVLWIILKRQSILTAAFIGAVAYSISFVMLAVTFIFFGVKMQVLIFGLSYITIVHAIIGGLSGVIAYLIVKRIPFDRIIPNYFN